MLRTITELGNFNLVRYGGRSRAKKPFRFLEVLFPPTTDVREKGRTLFGDVNHLVNTASCHNMPGLKVKGFENEF